MDLFQELVFPQSSSHLELLEYLLFITLLLFLPYLSVLIGTTFFSIMHFGKGNSTGNRNYLKFAKELIDIFTRNKGMVFSLGVIPIISLMFLYLQLMLNSGFVSSSHLLFGLAIFLAAAISIYTYKYSFRLKNIFSLVNADKVEEESWLNEFEGFRKSNSKLLAKSGWIGLILLLIVAYVIIGVVQLANDSSNWNESNSLIFLIFNIKTFLYFTFYLSFSLAITCAAILFKYFKKGEQDYSEEYLSYIKSFSLKTGLIFTFIQPLLFVLTVISTPVKSLSFSMFIVVMIVLLLMLLVSIIFYLMYRESKTHLGSNLVFVFLILISAIIYKDLITFDTANERHEFELSKNYAAFVNQIKEEAGVLEEVVISGEDIYNAKCIACHRFDEKLVGPAYKDVLPKYENKREDLIKFVLNPVKVNPDFPSMPNQGLKPKEAEAIADYIMSTYKK